MLGFAGCMCHDFQTLPHQYKRRRSFNPQHTTFIGSDIPRFLEDTLSMNKTGYNYFNKELNIATIHETFVDSDAAVLRVENLINSPVNEPFTELFKVINFSVLGDANSALISALEGWNPIYFPYEDGFNKTL